MKKRLAIYHLVLGLTLGLVGVASANGTSPEPAQPACEYVGYDKGLFIDSCDGKFKMVFNIQLQPQSHLGWC